MTKVVVAGALANKPGNGGEAWVRLSWIRGFERLGLDVAFVEEGGVGGEDWFDAITGRFGLEGRAWLTGRDGGAAPREAIAAADLLVNISGNLRDPALLKLPRTRAYLDLDPGYTQLWDAQGLLGDTLDRHEHLLTVGLSIGTEACDIPTGGRRWRALPPPVVLEDWPVEPLPDELRFTTVASWRGGIGRPEHRGRLLGQKAHEFRRIADLPSKVPAVLEVALDIHPGDEADRDLLLAGGWRLEDPSRLAGTPEAFREYVRGSAGEVSPAQGVYVETGSGWFSDRTTRYLATGRPAVVQETGLPDAVRTGQGLLTFLTPQEAARAIEAVCADPEHHARAARRLAEEHFASERVLGPLLQDLLD